MKEGYQRLDSGGNYLVLLKHGNLNATQGRRSNVAGIYQATEAG